MPHDSQNEDADFLIDAVADAHLMLTAFQNAGANRFDITIKSLDGKKVKFHRSLTIKSLRSKIPILFQHAEKAQLSIILRPHSNTTVLIQLDDITVSAVNLISPYSFIVLETSPDNYQAFVAVAGVKSKFDSVDARHQFIQAVNADGGGDRRRAACRLTKCKTVN